MKPLQAAAAGEAAAAEVTLTALQSAIAKGRDKDALVTAKLKIGKFGAKVGAAKEGPPSKKAKIVGDLQGQGWLSAAPQPPPVLMPLPDTAVKEVPSSFHGSAAYLAMFAE